MYCKRIPGAVIERAATPRTPAGVQFETGILRFYLLMHVSIRNIRVTCPPFHA